MLWVYILRNPKGHFYHCAFDVEMTFDQARKLVVIKRHRAAGNVGIGFPAASTCCWILSAQIQPLETVIEKISELNSAAARLGCKLEAPFMTLSFMTLSPIPELKLTDQGLVDAVNMKLTSSIAE